jgi:hypothetical protein
VAVVVVAAVLLTQVLLVLEYNLVSQDKAEVLDTGIVAALTQILRLILVQVAAELVL